MRYFFRSWKALSHSSSHLSHSAILIALQKMLASIGGPREEVVECGCLFGQALDLLQGSWRFHL